jgi:hypothetical protein
MRPSRGPSFDRRSSSRSCHGLTASDLRRLRARPERSHPVSHPDMQRGHLPRWEVASELRGRYWDRTSDPFGVNKVEIHSGPGRLYELAGSGLSSCRCVSAALAWLFKIVSPTSPSGPEQALAGTGIPSRKLRSAGPRPPGPGGAPYRTNDLDQAGAVWLPLVRDGSRSRAGRPGVAGVRGRSPGRRRPVPGCRAGGPARRRRPQPPERWFGDTRWPTHIGRTTCRPRGRA